MEFVSELQEYIPHFADDLRDFAWIAGAAFLALILGYEREQRDKPAGVRTHMIVATASALFISFGDPIVAHFSGESNTTPVTSDPLRLIEAVITGVSFLGAGTIFRRNEADLVQGLTTAASLLLSAGIGIAMAANRPVLAIAVTLLGLFILRPMKRLH